MPTNDAARHWEERVDAWLAAEDAFERVTAEPGRQAVDVLDPRPGEAVLDVGCGAGRATNELGRRVGPAGRAVGIDLAEGLVARGRERALANVSFTVGDAETHDLGSGEFDAGFSLFGAMFFNDPVAAFTNIRRALRRGGRIAIVSWQGVFANEWILVPVLAMSSVTGTLPQPPAPDEPGPFALSEPDRVRAILDAAGYTSIEVTPANGEVVWPEDGIGELTGLATTVGPVGETMRASDEETRAAIREAISTALGSRVVDGELRLSRGTLLTTGFA